MPFYVSYDEGWGQERTWRWGSCVSEFIRSATHPGHSALCFSFFSKAQYGSPCICLFYLSLPCNHLPYCLIASLSVFLALSFCFFFFCSVCFCFQSFSVFFYFSMSLSFSPQCVCVCVILIVTHRAVVSDCSVIRKSSSWVLLQGEDNSNHVDRVITETHGHSHTNTDGQILSWWFELVLNHSWVWGPLLVHAEGVFLFVCIFMCLCGFP